MTYKQHKYKHSTREGMQWMNPSPEEDREQSPQTFILMHEQDQYVALLEYSTVKPQTALTQKFQEQHLRPHFKESHGMQDLRPAHNSWDQIC